MAAQVLRGNHAVSDMGYIICTGTVQQHDLCKFNHGLLASNISPVSSSNHSFSERSEQPYDRSYKEHPIFVVFPS